MILQSKEKKIMIVLGILYIYTYVYMAIKKYIAPVQKQEKKKKRK